MACDHNKLRTPYCPHCGEPNPKATPEQQILSHFRSTLRKGIQRRANIEYEMKESGDNSNQMKNKLKNQIVSNDKWAKWLETLESIDAFKE